MHHKKNVTDAVRAANQVNAQSSTGPRTEKGKSTTSHNALRHEILSRKVEFDSDEEPEYQRVSQYWNNHYQPKGALEQFLVEEITNISWKLGITENLEIQELSKRTYIRSGIGSVFSGELRLPISSLDLPLDLGWDCERMVVRALAGSDRGTTDTSRGPAVVQNQVVEGVQASHNRHRQTGDQLEVQAVLGSSLETMTRYRSALKRDFYRATDMLRKEQGERREDKK